MLSVIFLLVAGQRDRCDGSLRVHARGAFARHTDHLAGGLRSLSAHYKTMNTP